MQLITIWRAGLTQQIDASELQAFIDVGWEVHRLHVLIFTGHERAQFEQLRTDLEHEGHNVEWRSAQDWTDEIESCDLVLVEKGWPDIQAAYLAHGIDAGSLVDALAKREQARHIDTPTVGEVSGSASKPKPKGRK